MVAPFGTNERGSGADAIFRARQLRPGRIGIACIPNPPVSLPLPWLPVNNVAHRQTRRFEDIEFSPARRSAVVR